MILVPSSCTPVLTMESWLGRFPPSEMPSSGVLKLNRTSATYYNHKGESYPGRSRIRACNNIADYRYYYALPSRGITVSCKWNQSSVQSTVHNTAGLLILVQDLSQHILAEHARLSVYLHTKCQRTRWYVFAEPPRTRIACLISARLQELVHLPCHIRFSLLGYIM